MNYSEPQKLPQTILCNYHKALWQKDHWSLKDFQGSGATETGSDHRLPDLLSRCNILCHSMVEVSLCHFPLQKIMLISYKTLRSVDQSPNRTVSYYFPFQSIPYLFIVIKHAASKIKSVQNHTDPLTCQTTHIVSAYDRKS